MNRCCALLLSWGVALLAGAPGEIAGRVVDARTGAPVRHARVRVTSIQPGVPGEEVALIAGEDGAFELTNVPEGPYQLSCERAGYLSAGQMVESRKPASASDAKPPAVIRLTPQAVIEGAVVDERNVAVPFANIQVYRRVAVDGRRQTPFVAGATADETGSFRVSGLTAGAYCLGVTVSTAAARRPKFVYPSLFYPSAVPGDQFIELLPGQEQQVRIRLPEPVPAREVRGQIVPAPESVTADMRPADLMMNTSFGFDFHWDQKNQTFRFAGVTPGLYVINITAQIEGQQRTATKTVAVADQDVGGIRLELSNQPALRGTTRVEGDTAPSIRSTPSITLHSSRFHFGASVQPDGSFEFRNLPPDRYRLEASSNGPAYLRAAWQGGRDVLRDGLMLSGEVPPEALEIVFGAPGGTVEGAIALPDSDQPDLIVVALLRRDGSAMVLEKQVSVSRSLPPNSALSVNSRPPVYGGTRFTLQGVAPGDYLLFAWPPDAQVEYAEPEFVRQYENLGKPVTVSAGKKITVAIDRWLFMNPR